MLFRSVDVRVMADAYKLEMSADCGSASWTALKIEAPGGQKGIQARAQHAAVVTANNRYLFLFGGYDGAKCLNDLWQFDLSAMSMRPIALDTPLPEARSRHTIHIVADLLHIFAGYDGGKPSAGDVFVLDVSDPAGMESGGGDAKKDDKDKKKADEPEEED